MNDIFNGDPRLILTDDGATFDFKGGQPVMDQGLENLVLISLFTRKGWAGNVLFQDVKQKIGSDFEDTANQSITLSTLNDVRQAGLLALDSEVFGDVEIEVTNPNSLTLRVVILIRPPVGDPFSLLLVKNGTNWIFQKINPAYRRI